jgi:enoyl-CoA hydratase/carnithine racemase
MAFETIIYRKDRGVAKIILNRPEVLNSQNRTMLQEIGAALDDAENDTAVRVVIITGSGKAFCTGVDLKFAQEELTTSQAEQDFFRLGNKMVLRKIENLPKPVIAAVNGYTMAGGFEILTVADLAIASEEAVISDQHMKLGLLGAGGAAYRVPLLIGIRKAKELILTGDSLTGKEAAQIGLVNRAVPAAQLESTVEDLAAKLAEKSPVAMRISKALINQSAEVDIEARLELILMSCLVGANSEDRDEGIQAFNEKRKPVFKGR